jgi:hypothetical protein
MEFEVPHMIIMSCGLVLQVFPDLYGDNHARLFIYWTVSGNAILLLQM